MIVASKVVTGHEVTVEPNTAHVVVRTAVGGSVLAETNEGHVLHETGYPDRWYLPREALLTNVVRTSKSTHCPFKGDANYWSVKLDDGTLLEDAIWGYEEPRSAAVDVQGELSFWTDAVEVVVDGVVVPS